MIFDNRKDHLKCYSKLLAYTLTKMTLNNLSNCETHEQERNVVRPDYLALSISGRKLNSQNGTKQIDNVKINDNYSLHFDVDKKEITIKNVRGGGEYQSWALLSYGYSECA